MSFKLTKSRSLVLRRGKVTESFSDRETNKESWENAHVHPQRKSLEPGNKSIWSSANVSRQVQSLDWPTLWLPFWATRSQWLCLGWRASTGGSGIFNDGACPSVASPSAAYKVSLWWRRTPVEGFQRQQSFTSGHKSEKCLEEEGKIRKSLSAAHGCWAMMTLPELWKVIPQHIYFLVRPIYHVLPSPSNLFTCSTGESPACVKEKVQILSSIHSSLSPERRILSLAPWSDAAS